MPEEVKKKWKIGDELEFKREGKTVKGKVVEFLETNMAVVEFEKQVTVKERVVARLV